MISGACSSHSRLFATLNSTELLYQPTLVSTETNSSNSLNSMWWTHRKRFKCGNQTSTSWTGSEEKKLWLSTKLKRPHHSMTWRSSSSLDLSLLHSLSYLSSDLSWLELSLQILPRRSQTTLRTLSKSGLGTWPLDQLTSVTSKLSLLAVLNSPFGIPDPFSETLMTKDGPLDLESVCSSSHSSSPRSSTKTVTNCRPRKLETSSTTCILTSTWIETHPPSTIFQSPCLEESSSWWSHLSSTNTHSRNFKFS